MKKKIFVLLFLMSGSLFASEAKEFELDFLLNLKKIKLFNKIFPVDMATIEQFDEILRKEKAFQERRKEKTITSDTWDITGYIEGLLDSDSQEDKAKMNGYFYLLLRISSGALNPKDISDVKTLFKIIQISDLLQNKHVMALCSEAFIKKITKGKVFDFPSKRVKTKVKPRSKYIFPFEQTTGIMDFYVLQKPAKEPKGRYHLSLPYGKKAILYLDSVGVYDKDNNLEYKFLLSQDSAEETTGDRYELKVSDDGKMFTVYKYGNDVLEKCTLPPHLTYSQIKLLYDIFYEKSITKIKGDDKEIFESLPQFLKNEVKKHLKNPKK